MSATTPDNRRLMTAIHALLDGSIDPTQRAELEHRLDTDASARQVYIRCVDMHCEIADALHTTPAHAGPIAPLASDHPAERRFVLWAAIGLAAMVAIGAAMLTVFLRTQPTAEVAPVLRENVATVIEATGVLTIGDDLAIPGSDYAAESIALASGTAEFQLTSGANVRLRGRTRMALHGPMRATLSEGTATFTCPPSAHGFAVKLPTGAEVVDLGTVFRVRVIDATRCVVSVIEGSVRIGDERIGEYEIVAGEAVAVSSDAVEPLGPLDPPARGWLADADATDRIERPFDGLDLSRGMTIEAAFRVDDPAKWDGTHIWSIFRREAPDRALLAIQLPRNMGEHGTRIGDAGHPGIAFGLVTGVYGELDVALDGRDGRPTIDALLDGHVHHVAGVYDRAKRTMTVYLDGVAIGSLDTAARGDLALNPTGSHGEVGGYYEREDFDGELLGVAIHDEPLSAEQINAHVDRWLTGAASWRVETHENAPAPPARSDEIENPESKGAPR